MAMLIKNNQVIGGGVTRAEELNAVDTSGIIGDAGSTTDTQSLIDGLAARESSILTGTLLAANWVSNTQTIDITGMTAELDGVVGMTSSATTTQINAAGEAGIRATGQDDGTVTFVCDTTPTVDIPVGVYVFK